MKKTLIVPVRLDSLSPNQQFMSQTIVSTYIKEDDKEEAKELGEVSCVLNGGVVIKDNETNESWYIKPELLWQAYRIVRQMQ